MELKNLFQNDDRAVSPVIGVILMVAITVILAAVIGTFVLGLGDEIGQEVNAGVTVDQVEGASTSDNEIRATWVSQGNADGIAFVGPDYEDEATEPITGSVGSTAIVNSGALSTQVNSGETLSVVAYQGEGIDNIDDLDDADKTTVIRTVSANFDISET